MLRTLIITLCLGTGLMAQLDAPVHRQLPGATKGTLFSAEQWILSVPENRRRPDSRKIDLPLLRIASTSPTPGEPVFFLSGGPGAPNLRNRVSSRLEGILAHHSVVLVGYRGAEGSVVLRCPEIAQAQQKDTGDLLGTESLGLMREALAASVARLRAEGIDLEGFTVPEVLEDLDAARKALDYQRIDLYSESYGTRLALLYAQLHPENVKRSILVGVNPPGGFVWDPDLTDDILREYARLWAQDPARVKRCPDLAAAIRRVNQRMPRRWLGYPIDPGKVKVLAFNMLSSCENAAMMLDAYVAADQGDASGLALLSFLMTRGAKSMGINLLGDAFGKGMLDYEPGRDYAQELVRPDSLL